MIIQGGNMSEKQKNGEKITADMRKDTHRRGFLRSVVGLASMLIAPDAKAQSQLTTAMQAEISNLIVANGGSSTIIPTIVAGTRADGITLSSTVGQLEQVYDSPPVLVQLLKKINVPVGDTVQQGLILLYNATNGSGSGGSGSGGTQPSQSAQLVIDQVVVNTVNNMVVNNGGSGTTVSTIVSGLRADGITLLSTVGQLLAVYDEPQALAQLLKGMPSYYTLYHAFYELYNLNFQQPTTPVAQQVTQVINLLQEGYDTLNNTINTSTGTAGYQLGAGTVTAKVTSGNSQIMGSYDITNGTISISSALWNNTVTYNIDNGLAQVTAGAQVVTIENQSFSLATGQVTLNAGSAFLTSTKIKALNSESAFEATATVSLYDKTVKASANVTYPEVASCATVVAVSNVDNLSSYISSIIQVAGQIFYAIGQTIDALNSGSSGGGGDEGYVPFSSGEVSKWLAESPLGSTSYSLGAVNNSISTNGTGAKQYPFLPNSEGLLTWQNPAYYSITNQQANGGNPVGTYYVDNQAFITNYNNNVLNSIGNNYWITQLPVGNGGGNANTVGSHLNLWTDYPVQISVTYQPAPWQVAVTPTLYASVDGLNWYPVGICGSFENPNAIDGGLTIEAATLMNEMNINISDWGTTYRNMQFILVDTVNQVQIPSGSVGLINKS